MLRVKLAEPQLQRFRSTRECYYICEQLSSLELFSGAGNSFTHLTMLFTVIFTPEKTSCLLPPLATSFMSSLATIDCSNTLEQSDHTSWF